MESLQEIVAPEMNALLTVTGTVTLGALSPFLLRSGQLIAAIIALICYLRWIRSHRGSWMVGVGLPAAWLLVSEAPLSLILIPVLWLHAVWMAFHFAYNTHAPCPHHMRLPRLWRQHACSNLGRCRICYLLYPLSILAISVGVGVFFLAP
jgi:hypothetical protein